MRLGYVTTLAAAMGLLALFAVACSSEEPTATPVPTVAPTQTPVPTNTPVPEAAAVLPSSGLEEPEPGVDYSNRERGVAADTCDPGLGAGDASVRDGVDGWFRVLWRFRWFKFRRTSIRMARTRFLVVTVRSRWRLRATSSFRTGLVGFTLRS